MPEPSHDYNNSLTGQFTKPEAKIEMLYIIIYCYVMFTIFFCTILRWIRFRFLLRAFAEKSFQKAWLLKKKTNKDHGQDSHYSKTIIYGLALLLYNISAPGWVNIIVEFLEFRKKKIKRQLYYNILCL